MKFFHTCAKEELLSERWLLEKRRDTDPLLCPGIWPPLRMASANISVAPLPYYHARSHQLKDYIDLRELVRLIRQESNFHNVIVPSARGFGPLIHLRMASVNISVAPLPYYHARSHQLKDYIDLRELVR
ncbi:hypothetical protein CEXT_233041 [Caerostris extrusa]|uniref:Uncharacterized protein n=1 Tax=Caerostris extrusa TaxID=172846 RepID=A0AAV4XSA5_CAEEX|nr:hypothetical protein CEXT_233041 [Caerostris extrusa]